jgi:hypothetical protein
MAMTTIAFDWYVLIFGALLILSGSISLLRGKRSLSDLKPDSIVRPLAMTVEIIAIIVGIYIFLFTDTWIGWKVSIFVVVGIAVVLSWLYYTKKIVFRWPIISSDKFNKELEAYARAIQPQSDVEVLSRNELLKTSDLISTANYEICFMGLTLETLRQATESIENALRRSVQVRILVPKRESDIPSRMEKVVITANIAKDINRTIDALSLRDAKPPLTQEEKRRLRVKEHTAIPSYSLILIDPGFGKSRYFHIEPYPFGISSEKRKIFVLSKNTVKQRELAELYYSAFNNLWDSEESSILL